MTETYDEGMRGGYIFSGALHVAIVALIVLGLPDFLKPKPIEEHPIAVRIVNPSDLTRALHRNTTPKDVDNDKQTDHPAEKPKPKTPDVLQPPNPTPPTSGAKHPDETSNDAKPPPAAPKPEPKPTPPPPPKPAPPKPETPPPPPPPVPTPKPPPPPPPPPKPVEKPPEKPAVKPPPKKPPPPKQDPFDAMLKDLTKQADKAEKTPPKKKAPQANKDNDFDSLLKNLSPEAATLEKNQQPPKRRTQQAQADEADNNPDAPLGAQLSTSELDAVRSQIERCWSPILGGKDEDSIVATIKMTIGPDGVVTSARIASVNQQTSLGQSIAQSALRAVLSKSPECSPLKLPADKYDTWKNTTVDFSPRDMH